MERSNDGATIMWVALVMLTSAVAGACATGLFWILRAGPVISLSAGGATFIGLATIGIAVVALLSRR